MTTLRPKVSLATERIEELGQEVDSIEGERDVLADRVEVMTGAAKAWEWMGDAARRLSEGGDDGDGSDGGEHGIDG